MINPFIQVPYSQTILPNERVFFSLSDGTNFFKKHNRSPSHIDLKYGRPESSPSQPSVKDVSPESQSDFPEMPDDFEVNLWFTYFSCSMRINFTPRRRNFNFD